MVCGSTGDLYFVSEQRDLRVRVSVVLCCVVVVCIGLN